MPKTDLRTFSGTIESWDSPEVAIPSGLSKVVISATRESWPASANALSFVMDLSLDNGASWILNYVGFTTTGGVVLDRGGNPILESSATIILPNPGSSTRKARAHIITGAALNTTVSITTS